MLWTFHEWRWQSVVGNVSLVNVPRRRRHREIWQRALMEGHWLHGWIVKPTVALLMVGDLSVDSCERVVAGVKNDRHLCVTRDTPVAGRLDRLSLGTRSRRRHESGIGGFLRSAALNWSEWFASLLATELTNLADQVGRLRLRDAGRLCCFGFGYCLAIVLCRRWDGLDFRSPPSAVKAVPQETKGASSVSFFTRVVAIRADAQ